MLLTFKAGLFLGFSLIISIGTQNLFLIKQGLKKQYSYLCALVCFLADCLLIVLGVLGINALITKFPVFDKIVLILGIIFLGIYGSLAIKRAFFVKNINGNLPLISEKAEIKRPLKLMLLALSFSILNPQAMLDTMVIIGGGANHFVHEAKYIFVLGTIAASFIWFFGLATATSLLSNKLINVHFWRILDCLSGIIMLSFAYKFLITLNI